MALDLSFYSLNPSCDYKGIPSLKNLTLASVRLNVSILESLVSGSGRLKKLQLFDCDGLYHLKIHASSLSFLYVQGKFNAINLSKSSNLKVFVVAHPKRDNAFATMISNDLEGLLGLEVLFIHDSFMQSSQLESQSDGCFWENMNCQSGSWLGFLRRVYIILGEIRLEDMELIKFLLLNTKVLDEFFIEIIETSKGMDQAKQLSLENQLHSLPKASSRAKIIFKNSS
ncbi:hypothetical protein AMTR_s00040p00106760 [Amborella trichopoda]|uniref:At1g61320/AtMIF1 LRR domain-containing protein n=1 Tax=Amborella trichopoda TaxID=13333 RepID=W1PYI9_AMBTC|nr:hypothetical protein AMTR_s00040p00106760 [Amborella trichopoda]